MVQQIASKKEFDDIVAKAGGKLIVIDFFATWCGPCKQIAPAFQRFSEDYKNAVFLKVDGDTEVADELGQLYNVECYPTFVFLKDGKEVSKLEGAEEDELKTSIEKHM